MRLLKILLMVCMLSLFANAAKNKKDIEVLNTVFENVVLNDIHKAILDTKNLKEAVLKKEVKNSKKEFSNLVASWKSVENFYILADYNEDFIDTPRYLDIFHNSNEDIKEQLDRTIKGDDEPRVALFKNSLKSINALEYMLFTKDITNNRINELTLAIINRIASHLNDINEEYEKLKTTFTKDIQKANATIINAIIQSTYKLKEWRFGDVIGKTKKYENKADNKRAEYFISKNSTTAIVAILSTYKKLLDDEKFFDYGDYLISLTDGKQMKILRASLKKALTLAKEIKNDDFESFDKKDELYENINKIHVVLFVEMLEDLSINAKILDADGD